MSLYRWPFFPLESSFVWLSSSCHTGPGSPRRLNHYEATASCRRPLSKGLGSSMLPVDPLKTSYRPLHDADVTNGVAGHDDSLPLMEKLKNASLSPEIGSSQPADSASTCRGVSSSELSMGLEMHDRKKYGLLHEIFFALEPNVATARTTYGTEFTLTCCGDGLAIHQSVCFRSRWEHVAATD